MGSEGSRRCAAPAEARPQLSSHAMEQRAGGGLPAVELARGQRRLVAARGPSGGPPAVELACDGTAKLKL